MDSGFTNFDLGFIRYKKRIGNSRQHNSTDLQCFAKPVSAKQKT